jgi:hypothetical protein
MPDGFGKRFVLLTGYLTFTFVKKEFESTAL